MEYRHKVTGILVNSDSELPPTLYEKKEAKLADAGSKKSKDSAPEGKVKSQEHKDGSVRKR